MEQPTINATVQQRTNFKIISLIFTENKARQFQTIHIKLSNFIYDDELVCFSLKIKFLFCSVFSMKQQKKNAAKNSGGILRVNMYMLCLSGHWIPFE